MKSYVYRCYDGEKLIYIGCTLNMKMRLYQHKRESDWFQFVTNTVVDEYPDRSGQFAEEALIDALNPPMNRKGRSDCDAIQYMESKGWQKPYFRSNGSPVQIQESLL